MTQALRCDAVFIGGGHNGLVCVYYLAAAGPEAHELTREGATIFPSVDGAPC